MGILNSREPVFLALYAEKAGSGILDMIALCREAGLPEPDFRQDDGQFVQTIWRDWLKDEVLAGLGLNDRQMKALPTFKSDRRITNSKYQKITGASRPTTKRDLEDLVARGVLVPAGSGRGAHYVVPSKRLINGSNGSSANRPGNDS